MCSSGVVKQNKLYFDTYKLPRGRFGAERERDGRRPDGPVQRGLRPAAGGDRHPGPERHHQELRAARPGELRHVPVHPRAVRRGDAHQGGRPEGEGPGEDPAGQGHGHGHRERQRHQEARGTYSV